jgi:hypothetical protein
LKIFPDVVKQHDGHRLGVFADGKGADGGRSHQKVFVEYFAPDYIFESAKKDASSEDKIAYAKGGQSYVKIHVQKIRKNQSDPENAAPKNQDGQFMPAAFPAFVAVPAALAALMLVCFFVHGEILPINLSIAQLFNCSVKKIIDNY